MLTSHVFFHLMTEVNHIASVLQVIQMVSHGVLLQLMVLDITLMENGEIVTATVKKVMPVLLKLSQPQRRGDFYSLITVLCGNHIGQMDVIN